MNKEHLLAQYGSIREAARQIGIPESTLRGKLGTVVKEWNESDVIQGNIAKSNKPQKPSRSAIRVLVIPDYHAQSDISNERMKWIGRFAAEYRPEHVVQIGDFGTFDSLSSHESKGSRAHAKRPSFMQEDLPSLCEALDIFGNELPAGYKPEMHCTFGNHEFRSDRHENENPETYGMFTNQIIGNMNSRGWTTSPYGAKYFIQQTCFIHNPVNAMGKPMSPAMLKHAQDYDLYYGHTHKKSEIHYPKANHSVTIVNGGCAMPYNYVPKYAKDALTGYWYGVQLLTLRDGKIDDIYWKSMRSLGESYGNNKG